MNAYDRTEEIDRYLSGDMTAEEMSSFASNLDIKREIEIQREIIFAIKGNAMKNALIEEERRIQRIESRKRFSKWFISGLSVACAAACLVGFLVVSPQVRTMDQLSKEAYNDYYINGYSYIIRGTDEDLDILADATEAIEKEDWAVADEKLLRIIDSKREKNIDIQQQQIVEEAEWLYTVSQMRQGNFFRAKRLLRKISDENGSYSGAAYRILENL